MNTIVQFECFETNLGLDEFLVNWEYYAKMLLSNHVEVSLSQRFGNDYKFAYISRHEWPEDSFEFNFLNERKVKYFLEGSVKIVQAGGYTPLQIERLHDEKNVFKKFLLFLPLNQVDIQRYKTLSFHSYLNIYQSYFENCTYSYILEFFVEEPQANSFSHWLKTNNHLHDAGMYKECRVLHE